MNCSRFTTGFVVVKRDASLPPSNKSINKSPLQRCRYFSVSSLTIVMKRFQEIKMNFHRRKMIATLDEHRRRLSSQHRQYRQAGGLVLDGRYARNVLLSTGASAVNTQRKNAAINRSPRSFSGLFVLSSSHGGSAVRNKFTPESRGRMPK